MSFVDPGHFGHETGLHEDEVSDNPIVQFHLWFQHALEMKLPQPEAMTLATCTVDGRPSARMVLLRGYDERGFVFFTNYQSRKGRELEENPQAALVLFWEPLDRQVRIEGRVEKALPEESDNYFTSRPRGSRLGAWASPQSQILEGREELERRVAEAEERFRMQEIIPRPPFWGGVRVIPQVIEFWQGRESRLHDRIRFQRLEGEKWRMERLGP